MAWHAAIFLMLSSMAGIAGETADSREMAGEDFPWASIGKIQLSGYDWLGSCTGTLVAPDLVLTAAHCFSDPRGKKQVPTHAFHFLLGLKRDTHAAHGTAKCFELLGPLPDRENPVAAFMKGDAALVRLAEPLTGTPLPLAETFEAAPGALVALAGYAKEKPFWPLVEKNCRVTWNKSLLAGTTCRASPGQSGSPVLVEEDGKPKVAGLVVAAEAGRDAIMIPAARLAPFLSGASCPK